MNLSHTISSTSCTVGNNTEHLIVSFRLSIVNSTRSSIFTHTITIGNVIPSSGLDVDVVLKVATLLRMILFPVKVSNLIGNLQSCIALSRTCPRGAVVVEGCALHQSTSFQANVGRSRRAVHAAAEQQLTADDKCRTLFTFIVTDTSIILHIELTAVEDAGVSRATSASEVVDYYQRVVVEVTLLGSAVILVDEELAIIIELTEIVVKSTNINSATIVVLFTSSITIAYFN